MASVRAAQPHVPPQRERHETVVIGAGQCGLAAAYYLAKRGIDFVVLEANDRVGDNWRSRYDSLRLYSPARYDGLPGMAFPLPRNAFPTGHQMADYLGSYAARFELPVRTGVAVDSLRPAEGVGDGYVITAGDRTFEAAQVVIAAGYFRQPYVPDFAADLDPGIRQLHSSDYRKPSQLANGPVLVVGVSHSGADLAFEVAKTHRTILSGKGHGQLPFSVDSRAGRFAWPIMKFVVWNVLTLRTPIGRKMAPEIRKGGAPLLRYRRDDPEQDRGVVTSAPGLYFLGLLFQYGFTSMLVVGAGRDAAYVVDRIAARAAAEPSPTKLASGVARP